MPRKTPGTTTTHRKRTTELLSPVIGSESEAKNGLGLPPTLAPPTNLEEEIRRRAYELYLQRRATAGANGNQNQDWLIAEREILSRHSGHDQHTA